MRRLILFKHRLIVSPTKVLPPVRRFLSGLCVRRVRQLVLHALAALSTRLQRDTYMSSTAANQPSPDHKPETAQPSKPLRPKGYHISVLTAQETGAPCRVQKSVFKGPINPC